MMNRNSSDNRISVSGLCLGVQGASVDFGCSDKYEILYFTRGCGKYTVEGHEYHVHENTALVIKPFSYVIACADQEELVGYSLRFSLNDDSRIKFLTDEMLGDVGSKLYTAFAIPELVYSIFEKLYVADDIPEEIQDIYIDALVREAISLLSISTGEGKEYNEDELGARVARYLNRNIDKNISLDKLAARFFVSKYHLCRAFKKYSGTSVHAYINQKRILYAKQLIEAGETASVVAYKVGYGDYSAFYRAYKSIVGKSPVRN